MKQKLLMTNFFGGNGVRLLVPRIGSNIFACTKASTIASDDVSDAEEILLRSAKGFEEMPSVRAFPFIGSAWVFIPLIGKYKINKLHIADIEKYKTYGSIYREKLGSYDIVSIFDPSDVEKMFRHEGKYPSRGAGAVSALSSYREYRKEWYKTNGLALLEGKEWYDLRTKVQIYMMRPKVIQAYIQQMDNIAKDFVSRIAYLRDENNEVPRFHQELYNWSLESVALVNLNTRLGCLDRNLPADSESAKITESIQIILSCLSKMDVRSSLMQMWKIFPTPLWKEFVKANDFFTITTFKYINRTLEDLKNKDEDEKLSLLRFLLCAPGFDASNVMTTVSDMIMAGIDTTANSAGFLFYQLARNSNVQEKLFEEIISVLPNRSDKLTSSTLNELRYLKACMKESFRMNPVVRGTARKLDHDIVLSGYRIPAGVLIFSAGQAAVKLEKYFKNADQFIPERWMDKDNKPHPFLHLPFGLGLRSCIGRRLAELELMCLVTEMIRNFKVEYHHEEIGLNTRFLNTPDRPLRFTFTDRPF